MLRQQDVYARLMQVGGILLFAFAAVLARPDTARADELRFCDQEEYNGEKCCTCGLVNGTVTGCLAVEQDGRRTCIKYDEGGSDRGFCSTEKCEVEVG